MIVVLQVRTILYHDAAQKDTLRDVLRITIAVSYILFSDAPSVQSKVLFLDTFTVKPS